MGKKIIIMNRILTFIISFFILSVSVHSQTQVLGRAVIRGSLTVGANGLEIDSSVISNDSLFLYDGATKIPVFLELAQADQYAEDNFIWAGDAGDYRGTNYLPDYADVSFAITNGTDAVSTAQAHGGTRSVLITSTASGDVAYGEVDITNSSIRRPTYAGLSYRLDFWIYVPSSESWSGNLTVESDGTTNGNQVWFNQDISSYEDSWYHVECDVDIEGDESNIFSIEYNAGGSGEIFYLDDIRWRTIYASLGSEEFDYADCESDIPTVNAETWSTYQGTWARSTDYAQSGSYSMKGTQTAGTPETMDFRLNGDMSLTEGYYLCEAYFYIPSGESIRQGDCGLYHRDASSVYWIEHLDQWLGDKGSWHKRQAVRYIESSTSRGFGIRMYSEDAGGGDIAYVDDFSMKKITF